MAQELNSAGFEHLLFLGDAVDDGILYGWYPIGDDRMLLASSLLAYVEELLSGQLSV